MIEALSRLAGRVAADPFFLAFALAGYARAEGLDDAALAARLGVAAAVLSRLRLCRSPRTDPAGFRADCGRIAAAFGADADALAEVARHGHAVAALRPAGEPGEPGYLLAARDREPGDAP